VARVLYLYCHPLPESFHGAIRTAALEGLARAGHQVDLLDLYAEGFDPVLTAEGRRNYHNLAVNRSGLEDYVARIQAAQVLIVQFPTWCFGPPAMLKGFFDRLMMPGVAFDLSDPKQVRPMLASLERVIGVVTYGRPRWMALAMQDPPRRMVTRYLRWFAARRARAEYLALYHLNVASDARRRAFIARVRGRMERL
jgi:NAD(P)H dehydrogenase (quinone)